MRFVTVLLGFVLLCVPAHARFQPQPCKNSYTTDQEIAEGKKAAAQVYKQMPVLPDSSPVTKYIQQLGNKLVQYAPGYRWPYQFHVVEMADINAFALPGGAIFVNLGTIQAAENEAQLAGVIAHEISHVVLRHATCNLTKQRTPGMLAGIGQIAAGVLLGGGAGALAAQGIGAVAGLGFLKMSRDAEKQADLLGTDMLYDAGYDPRGMAQFFEIIQSRYGEGGAQLTSDHPNPGNRTAYVNDEIATLPPKTHYVETSSEFTRIKKLVAGMHAYTAREVASGAWKKEAPPQTVASSVNAPAIDPTPSGSWQSIDGRGFQIEYPGNWRAYSGQGPATTIAPDGGIQDQRNGSTIVYGVLIDTYNSHQGNDLIANTQQLLAKLMQTNPGMSCGQGTNLAVGGRAARSAECTSGAERDWIVSVGRPNGDLQYIVFVAPASEFEKMRPAYRRMLESFRLR
jgi:Zn-dependent protease with chaperone function